MSIATDTKVAKHDDEFRVIHAALNAIVERLEALEGMNGNAVVEGDEIEPKATRNGKLRKSR